MVLLWVTETIKYANQKFGKYDTWNIKMDQKLNILDEIRTFLETKGPLGNEWVNVVDL